MIRLENISKTFNTADGSVEALKNINININKGDIFGIIGMSGAGKSTLVRTINLLEKPTAGKVYFNNKDITDISGKELRDTRRKITMIFQGFNLLMQRNCLRNVCFPLELSGMPKDKAKERALELLDLVGLKEKALSYPSQLSGGQQQRVAIARALATEPDVLLCDEATSALDPKTTNAILDLISDINNKLGITVIIITHQMSVVESICKNVAILENGEVVETGLVEEVFSSPKSDAGKRLVFPEFSNSLFEENKENSNVRVIRAVFNGSESANVPLIARLAKDTGIEANISYASTKSIGKKAYGSMLLTFKNEDFDKAYEYLANNGEVEIQEVTSNV